MFPNGSRNRPEYEEATLKQVVASLFRWRLARYLVASATGTAVDLTSLSLLYAAGLAAGGAAAIGYALGTLAHWLVSSRFVFPDRLAEAGLRRGAQQVLFIASAILGIGMTSLIVSWGVAGGIHILAAKAIAMIASFVAVFLVRLTIVFRASR